MIDKAHENGFEVTLLYVALRDENLAIKRVEDRVQKGGHGVPSEIIKKRYRQSNHNLSAVAFKSDNVFIYDNSSEKVQNQLKNFVDHNPEVKLKNNPENKNDRPSY